MLRSNSSMHISNCSLCGWSRHTRASPYRSCIQPTNCSQLKGNTEVAEHVRFMLDSVTRMRAMVDGLLRYSGLLRIGHIEMTA